MVAWPLLLLVDCQGLELLCWYSKVFWIIHKLARLLVDLLELWVSGRDLLGLFIRWSPPDIFGHHCFHHCWVSDSFLSSLPLWDFSYHCFVHLFFFLSFTCLLFSLFFLLVSQLPRASKVKLFFKGTTYLICKGWDLKSRRVWRAFYPPYFHWEPHHFANIKYATELLSDPAGSIIFPQNSTSPHLCWKQDWALNKKQVEN